MITDLEYLTHSEGKLTAVAIPIELWRQLLPNENADLDKVSNAIKDYYLSYYLNKAMDKGKQSPTHERTEALHFLED
ncbi:hypothetical protein Syn7502_00635 [Synechococcus sp. PCC 7502]|uniref:hypothetical protein n=1 Tax=Synechococcus sp. PCC 7502 TaxID=1173263 RepID=UPI00029F827D|nr:hypothetical protein [Synechococcus sp. PCC 7502]AFY72784.1 hypothetical protein Syn7502_00635 [Synechococcus sp. PCC 7502]